jgi:hypothetical protein
MLREGAEDGAVVFVATMYAASALENCVLMVGGCRANVNVCERVASVKVVYFRPTITLSVKVKIRRGVEPIFDNQSGTRGKEFRYFFHLDFSYHFILQLVHKTI